MEGRPAEVPLPKGVRRREALRQRRRLGSRSSLCACVCPVVAPPGFGCVRVPAFGLRWAACVGWDGFWDFLFFNQQLTEQPFCR